MEYGIAIGVTAFFLLIYLFTRTKEREPFSKYLSDEEYLTCAREYNKNSALPTLGSKCEYDVKAVLHGINKGKRKANKLFPTVYAEIDGIKAELKAAKKQSFAALQELPANDGRARILQYADLFLSHSNYVLSEERVYVLFSECRKHTITYEELALLPLATKFLLLKKLSYVLSRISALEKLRKRSEKIAAKPQNYENSNKYREIKDNSVFLYYSAKARGEECPRSAELVFFDVTEGIDKTVKNVIGSLAALKTFDFTRFYRPLELINGFESFKNLSAGAKDGFLTELSAEAKAINLDEYAYAYVLCGYAERVSPSKQCAKRLKTGKSTLLFVRSTHDMRLLSRCLHSTDLAEICFGKPRNTRKSILNSVVFENSFKLYRSNLSQNLGISVESGYLKITPDLPDFVSRVTADFSVCGTSHRLIVERGGEDCLFVNGTKMEGIPAVKLGDRPLTVLRRISGKSKPTD